MKPATRPTSSSHANKPSSLSSKAAWLIAGLGGQIVGVTFLIELSFLNGRRKLDGYDVHSLIQYAGE